MRLIYTSHDQKKGRLLSKFLASEGIENQLEIQTGTDWGNADYGDIICRLWIYDEDKLELAERWMQKFEENPEVPIFSGKDLSEEGMANKKIASDSSIIDKKTGKITLILILVCSFLFIFSESTAPPISSYPNYLPPIALFNPPVKKALFYDYPKKYELADQLVRLYGLDQLQIPQELPVDGQILLKRYENTPAWEGFYPLIVSSLKKKEWDLRMNAPLFEKIEKGEYWRFFTPCLLHSDILHLLFNMLWLLFLGKQMEERLKTGRYLLFIFLTGVFSNTSQYLMSGANFIGISGVLCAMLTFIWIRQKIAPWEGYPLQKATITFMMVFIFAMLSIQLVSFYLEIGEQVSMVPGIANTAHLSGAALGAILGRFSFFSWRT